MNGKKGSQVEIRVMNNESGGKGGEKKMRQNGESSIQLWIWRVWEFAKEDSNRLKFSFKVGLAVLLVSLLILFRAPYQVFGTNIIWSILTVAIMFEYTVGTHTYIHASILPISSSAAALNGNARLLYMHHVSMLIMHARLLNGNANT